MRQKMNFLKMLILLATLLPAIATAGVTIHYSGSVSSKDKSSEIIELISNYASDNKWKIEKSKSGITVFPDEWCEPLSINFEGLNIVEDFVKTQFSGPDVHVSVIKLLRKIKPLTSSLEVTDEGEYWLTSDFNKLSENIEIVNQMIKQLKQQRSDVKGPTKLPDGKILDVHT
jgi:hypothetical protein